LSEHAPSCAPGGTKAAEAWLRAEENHDRSNARVVDRIIVALPLELDHAAQSALVQTFAQSLGHGRVPWFAGLHNGPQDARNPHAHLLVRDRDFETGKRVIGLSNKDAVHKVRALWAKVCNDALRAQGVPARIDHRSNAARGIDRIPTVHVGQRLTHMPPPQTDEETRMTINEKIKAANVAMDAARQIENDAHEMAVDLAKALGEERAARLAAEAVVEEERKRRMMAESKLHRTVDDAKAAIRRVQEELQAQVDEARNLLRTLHTRILPHQIKPDWLEDSVWHAMLALVRRAGGPRPTGATAPMPVRALPEVPRQTK